MKTVRLMIAAMLVAMPLAAQAQAQTRPGKPAAARPTDMTPAEQAELRAGLKDGFPFGDTDGDRKLTKKELLTYGMKQGWGSMILEKKWKAADHDRNGWLTTDEYADMMIAETNVQRAKAATAARKK